MSGGDPGPKRAPRAAEPARHERRRALLLAALASCIGLSLLPLVLFERAEWLFWWIDSAYVLFAAAAGWWSFRTASRLRHNERAAWQFFALGSSAFALGSMIWGIYEYFGIYNPVPSLADVGVLAFPVFCIVGIWYYRTRTPSLDVTLVQIGNLGILLASILLANLILFYDLFSKSLAEPEYLIAFAYQVMDTCALFFGVISIALYNRGQSRRVIGLIVLALLTLTVIDGVATHGILMGEFDSTHLLNGLYLLVFAFICWAAFEQDALGGGVTAEVVAAHDDARSRQGETLIPPLAVAGVLVVALVNPEGLSRALLPYAAASSMLFLISLGLRDWWAHRIELRLRSQTRASELRLQESEKLLQQRNEELAQANRDLWDEMKARMRVQEELRHSQKLEALGQLTGGVAHDFNNLLAVILGNLELLEGRVAADPELAEIAHEASAAADRGASLTQRLLAFSRKQQLAPSTIRLGALLGNMRALLDRTLGETIQIGIHVPDELWNCLADPAQLENAILNLAINARDAMRGGGELEIEASNAAIDACQAAQLSGIPPGEYVRICVRDTGTGMPPEVREKVFDPFFTTKGVGEGSGLGLSMVYGFVKQSGGHVALYSETGLGTTIELYLPRSDQPVAEARPEGDTEPARSRGERVLVVEDEPAVRRLLVTILDDLGYEVAEAGDVDQALAALDQLERVDLVLSDLVLPGGMSGLDLAARVRMRADRVRLVLMSGYSADALAREAEPPGVVLLRKPFRRNKLAQAIRSALDAA